MDNLDEHPVFDILGVDLNLPEKEKERDLLRAKEKGFFL